MIHTQPYRQHDRTEQLFLSFPELRKDHDGEHTAGSHLKRPYFLEAELFIEEWVQRLLHGLGALFRAGLGAEEVVRMEVVRCTYGGCCSTEVCTHKNRFPSAIA